MLTSPLITSPILVRLAVCAALLAIPVAPARAEWPEKPITITVGFGAGGTTDIAARAVAELVAKRLGQPVVVENRAGGGGAVAATALVKMPADGYNLVATTSTTITLDPQITRLGFTPNDFTYVAAIGEFPEAFIALPKKGWKNLSDALAAAKAAGRMNYASSTSLDRMITSVLAKKIGAQLVPVPTRSGAEVVTQVMGGHVDLGYSSGAYYPQAEAGEVAVLAVLGEKRLTGLPGVPTLKELGYGLSSVNLVLFVAPKGLPTEIAAKLYAAFAAAGADPSIVDLMQKRSLNNFVETGEMLAKTIRSQTEGYAQLIEASK
jgi:tripartite-type tricarboxylate transporter receptor subunit TctC